jgi:rhodanese-related sulfurtransferase
MKTYIKFLFVLFVIPMVLTTGCKEEATETDYEVMTQYMVDNNLDLPNILDGWITSASAVVNEADGTVADYYVIDIRAAADFDAGHIKGAVNTTLADIVATAGNAGGKNPLVVCYTGQTAAHGVVALRLSGYPGAKVLKWGMAGWNNDFAGKWLANSGADNGAIGVGHANWTFPASVAADGDFDDPVITSTETEGSAILAERVNELLKGFNGVASADVLNTPDNYFINNFWAEADTEHYGHIKGAHRINTLTLAGGEFNKLDPEKAVVTYCWTGQTSSMVTAYLKVLGYNPKSLKFGVNSMIYPNLESHQYTAPSVDYIYE